LEGERLAEISLCAVITGDIIGSSRIPASSRKEFLDHLKGLFCIIGDRWSSLLLTPFEIYRGDGFQAALSDPSAALRVALVIRSGLRSGFVTSGSLMISDARIAIGVGRTDFLPASTSAEADGEAFRRSGQLLDGMSDFHLLVSTPAKEIDEELNVELGLVDTIIDKWTAAQAEVMKYVLLAHSQREIAEIVHVSPAAVNQRLKAAGSRAIESAVRRYEQVINNMVFTLRAAETKMDR
jgi:hypothetical protein